MTHILLEWAGSRLMQLMSAAGWREVAVECGHPDFSSPPLLHLLPMQATSGHLLAGLAVALKNGNVAFWVGHFSPALPSIQFASMTLPLHLQVSAWAEERICQFLVFSTKRIAAEMSNWGRGMVRGRIRVRARVPLPEMSNQLHAAADSCLVLRVLRKWKVIIISFLHHA